MVQPIQKTWNPNTLQWEQIVPTKEEFDDALNEIDDLSQDIGNLNSLTTEEQSNLVGAINEIDGAIDTHRSDYVLQVPYGVATGSANTYTVTLDPIPVSYVDGMAIAVKINVNNTGTSTINVNGLGAKTIKKPNGNDVSAGNLKASSIYSMRYNGTNFILQGSDAAGDATPGDVISGKTFSNDGGEQTGTLELTGDAVAANVLSSKTFYNTNAKTKVTGSMINRGAITITPGKTAQNIPAGYHNGSGYVVGDADLKAENIKSGVNIFNIIGTLGAGGFVKNVQYGTASMANGVNSLNVTITAVDRSKSYLVFSYTNSLADGVLSGDRTWKTLGRLSSNTNIEFSRAALSSNGITYISWFVIEFEIGLQVQYGYATIAYGTTETNISISTVDRSKTFVIITEHAHEYEAYPSKARHQAILTSDTNLQLKRLAGDTHSNANHYVAWQVIEFL